MTLYRSILILCLVTSHIMVYGQVAPDAKDISPLLIGEKVPNVQMVSASNASDSLLNIVSEKPTVLVFYRGGWCPFCNIQLAEMNKIKDEILELGFQIVAIGADAPDKLKGTSDDKELQYSLYSDADTRISQAFGIAFLAPDRKKEQLKHFSNGANPGNLPVPSVFVIDRQGYIQFEYINPDYKIRLKSEMLLAVLKVLGDQGISK
ncbi:MAG: AhpC/TSA family protein [Cyclobacteriaceae bacterium]|nr:AhpC/TSA family protein [Cyclobacteriaceae bacterium SS2]